jgi:hypothetical protein
MRLKQPAVLILEDVHWAGSNSLTLLSRLNRVIEKLPVLILASYRDDERPEVSGLLPRMHEIHLRRLTSASIAELCEAMLGPGGRQPQVIALLSRETEGNPFFLSVTARPEAGQLSMVVSIPSGVHRWDAADVASRLSKIFQIALFTTPRQSGGSSTWVPHRPDVGLDTWLTSAPTPLC